MLRVLMAGLVGGVVLVVWSAVFAAVGPVGSGPSGGDGGVGGSALSRVLEQRFGDLRGYIPLGPAEARAGGQASALSVQQAGAAGAAVQSHAASLDPFAVVQGLGVACLAATLAALLMSLTGGKQKAFADRVMVAVLLGVFAACAMLLPGGRWAEFSLAEATPLVGEVVVGWLLAGMVIAVMLRPQQRRARA
ncbi:MAG: hypothetical protein Q9O74_04185 [Planctomycetota bacterium]|nr:hypothetical protein [Planctomycetota bacterium]